MSKLAGSDQSGFCATLVDEWARAGVRHAVVSPGSRSTPMALALAANDEIRVHVRLDERSAAFLGLGIGLQTGVPAVVLTTSGTAAAELHAAVVEAHQALVPLIVCTADRPAELHGVGAPQTIEQAGLYGGAVRYAVDVGVPSGDASGAWRSLGARLVTDATCSPAGPGPVHLNVAFRDPLDGEPGELPPGRPGGAPWHSVHPGIRAPGDALAGLVHQSRRPLLVAGGGCGTPSLVLEAAARLGWPLIADPRSGCRRSGEPPHGAAVVAAADALLRAPEVAGSRPDLVLRLGGAWASKVVNDWLGDTAREGAAHVLVDPYGEWRDPGHEVATVVRAHPDQVLGWLLANPAAARVDNAWAASWQSAEELAQEAISSSLDRLSRADELTEPDIARRLAAHRGVGTLVASSSMPIRDVESFSAPSPRYPRVLSNRGANGIDGVASTTIGVATGGGGSEGSVVGLLGDLAFLHDLSALVRPAPVGEGSGAAAGFGSGAACGLVVLDNRGGGIFSYLPQARSLPSERFEQLFGTPQAADVAELARAAGCSVNEARKASDLEDALDAFLERVGNGESGVLVCHTDRERNVAVHDELNQAVAEAISRGRRR